MDAVLNWLWQGAVVAACSFVMLFALQRAGANVRSAVCWAALLLIVALPALPPPSSTMPAGVAFLPMQPDAVVSLPDAWWTSTIVILAAWMVWASIQLARFVSAIVAIRRARARSRRFPPHLESGLPHWSRIHSEGRRATLVLSNSVTSAAVFGWGRPMIAVAPSLVRTLDPNDLDRVLIHEWAHVQRRDDVVNVLQVAVRIAAGWHPALWWIDRRLYLEREIACDEVTVAITGSPKSYAECLLKLSTLRGTSRPMETAPAVFTPSGLRARVAKIVSPHPFIAPRLSAAVAALTIVVLCLASVAVGGVTLVEATAFAQPSASARTLTPNLSSHSQVPVAPPLASDTTTKASPRRVPARSSSPQGSKKEQPLPVPQRAPEPTALPTFHEPKAADVTRPAAVDPVPAASVTPELPNVPLPDQAPQVTAEPPRSPWTAAAASGVAIGRKSKDAGLATAGFFTRFARRVTGSF
jgi:beta-lactamase regulating signal transducer with metallopeptidase domain